MTGANDVLNRDFDLVLVLSGGNALGAFQAGVYQALHENSLRPDWIVGASIGAINGAIIAGTAVDCRLQALSRFWEPDTYAADLGRSPWYTSILEAGRRTAAATWTLGVGRPGIFGPLLSSLSPWTDNRSSIFETNQLEATLERIVDFEELNKGECRFTATAVDLATGDDVIFDGNDSRIGSRQIRASAALPVVFPPVEVDGRWLVDGGLSANLPLDPVFLDPPSRPTLCVAVDLLPLGQRLPTTIGETASRMQDLIFAAQSRRSIARWRSAYADRKDVRISLVRIAYTEQEAEVAGKALDFSGPTIEQRWLAGYESALGIIQRIRMGALGIGRRGLNVVDL